jgi:hypothetical protein
MYTCFTDSIGAAKIVDERTDQVVAGFDLDNDKKYNENELASLIIFLIDPQSFPSYCPRFGFKDYKEKWEKLPIKERLVLAGAFCAAEYDRLEYEERISNG